MTKKVLKGIVTSAKNNKTIVVQVTRKFKHPFYEKITSKKAKVSITEIRQPDLNAKLVAQNIAEQIERRVAIKRAMRQVGNRCIQNGAQGIKILISGRLGGADIARSDKMIEGRVPLHTLRAKIDYAIAEARTTYGIIGVKVWIYKGELMAKDVEKEKKERVKNAATSKN